MRVIIIIIIILVFANFSPHRSLKSYWQQISTALQDSSQYSDRSQQCCSLDGLDSSSDFQLFQSSF